MWVAFILYRYEFSAEESTQVDPTDGKKKKKKSSLSKQVDQLWIVGSANVFKMAAMRERFFPYSSKIFNKRDTILRTLVKAIFNVSFSDNLPHRKKFV